MSDQEDFDAGDAGSSSYVPIQAGAVKKGGYCMLKGFPCKVTDYSTAKPGKHGSAKATIVGLDIFTSKKYEDSCPTGHNMQEPIVTKVELEVADISADDFVSFILPDGQLKEDLKLPIADDELYRELSELWKAYHENGQIFFTIISACSNEKIVSGRVRD